MKTSLEDSTGSAPDAKRVKQSLSEEENFWKNDLLLLSQNSCLIFIRPSKLKISSPSQQSPCIIPDLPISLRFAFPHYINPASFVFDNKLFILGHFDDPSVQDSTVVDSTDDDSTNDDDDSMVGDCTDDDGSLFPMPVHEVKLNSVKPNTSFKDVLIPSQIIPALKDFKRKPIVENIGNKIYVLNIAYRDINQNYWRKHFEVLDLDDVGSGWTVLPNPCFLSDFNYRICITFGHYVVGSRLYLLVGNFFEQFLYFFDTKTISWGVVEDSVRSLFTKILVDVPIDGKSVSIPRFDYPVIFKFECEDMDDEPENRRLFAVAVTTLGRPLFYQQIFDDVFPDVLPASFCNQLSGIFVVKDGLYCGIFTGTVDVGKPDFFCISFFKLCPLDSPDATGLESEVAEERKFLKVQVLEKSIFNMPSDFDNVELDATFLV